MSQETHRSDPSDRRPRRVRPALVLALAVVGAAAATTVAVAATGGASTARPAKAAAAKQRTQTLRVYSKQVSFTFTAANGKVVDPPPPSINPGDSFEATALDYIGTHRRHARNWSYSDHLRCVVNATRVPECESEVAVGGSLLLFKGDTIVGGSGKYLGATGRAVSKEIANSNDSDIVVTVRLR